MIEDYTIRNSNKEKLLRVILDNQLKCDNHIKNICNEAEKRINTLASIAPYFNKGKRKMLMKSVSATSF